MQRFLARRLTTTAPGTGASPSHEGTLVLTPESKQYDSFGGDLIVVDLAADVEVNGRDEFFKGIGWLEDAIQHRRTLSLDMQWRPDRGGGSDNPVALLQFADDQMVLLLRTHTSRWLPRLVVQVLTGVAVRKVCVGHDSSEQCKKLEISFSLHLGNVVDVAMMALQKGLYATDLRRLSEQLGFRMRRELCVSRSDWQAPVLSAEQIRFAAEDAYFTYLVFCKLDELPDILPPEADRGGSPEQAGSTLAIQPGWVKESICRRHDGLYCALCNKGPMLNPLNVQQHIQSRMHVNKSPAVVDSTSPAGDLSESLRARGVIVSDGTHRRAKSGQYLCELCDAGPFADRQGAESHLQGRQHLKRERHLEEREEGLGGVPEELEVEGIQISNRGGFRCALCDAGPFSDFQSAEQHLRGRPHQKRAAAGLGSGPRPGVKGVGGEGAPVLTPRLKVSREQLQTLPGYVGVWEGELWCSLCNAHTNSLPAVLEHLCSKGHSKVCRKNGYEELLYVAERQRLEELETGLPVVREEGIFFPPSKQSAKVPPGARDTSPAPQRALSGPRLPRGHSQGSPIGSPSSQSPSAHGTGELTGLWSSWKGGAKAPRRLVRQSYDFESISQRPDTTATEAWSSWQGPAKAGGFPSSQLESSRLGAPATEDSDREATGALYVATMDVPVPPAAWTWDPSTCLILHNGDHIRVVMEDDEWLYGLAGDQEGWFERRAARPKFKPGDVAYLHEDMRTPPAGWVWDPSTCLVAAAGEQLFVLDAEDDDWMYCECGEQQGWVLSSAVRARWPAQSHRRSAGFQHEGQTTVQSNERSIPQVGCDDGWVAIPGGRPPQALVLHREAGLQQAAAYSLHTKRRYPDTCTKLLAPVAHQEDGPLVDQTVPFTELHVGRLAVAQCRVVGAPAGFQDTNFLTLLPGTSVLIEHVQDDWVWAIAGEESGWAPMHAIRPARQSRSMLG